MKKIVSLEECRNYDYKEVKATIEKSFDNLGGIDKYINKGDRVLLKLNLLMSKKPEQAVTTHPVFTKALAKILIDYGAKILIGDSPGGPYSRSMLKRVYKACGIDEIAEEVGAELNYNTNIMEVKNDEGIILKKLTVVEMLKDVDKVISVSKLKTHGMMMFTGAVKNMFGIVPGVLKAEYHLRMPENEDFANALIDICTAANPVLSFMDGIVGMEGAGPSAGDPRDIGAVIASDSPYHLDVVATSIINLDPIKVPTIKGCIDRGLCKGNLDDIGLYGESINKFKVNDFNIPAIRSISFVTDKYPKFLQDIYTRLLQPKPVFNYDLCIGCKDCAENCPPKVIDMVDRKPVVKLDGCIRCFCCQELCPKEAVDIHRPWLMKLLAKL